MATQCTVQPEKQHLKEVLCVPLRALQSDNRVFGRFLGQGVAQWFAHPCSGAVCWGMSCFCSWHPVFAPCSSKVGVGLWVFFFCILLCIIWASCSRTQLFLVPYRKGEMGGRGWDGYHWLNGHEFEQTLGGSEGHESLAFSNLWGHKALDITW